MKRAMQVATRLVVGVRTQTPLARCIPAPHARRETEFGKLNHSRDMAAINKQDVVRMNRDTLYSLGPLNLEAAPVTITLPDTGMRFMLMQVLLSFGW
jgi:hypothetical protein